MRRNLIATILGGVVLAVAALFLVFAYSNASLRTVQGYQVFAKFDRVDGLKEGSDVRLSGIKVGTVISQKIDPQSYLAVVRMNIIPSVKLPTDTAAEIVSDGLLGSKYMALVPGAADTMIEPDGEIQFTEPPLNIETLVGRFIFGQAGKETEGGEPAK